MADKHNIPVDNSASTQQSSQVTVSYPPIQRRVYAGLPQATVTTDVQVSCVSATLCDASNYYGCQNSL